MARVVGVVLALVATAFAAAATEADGLAIAWCCSEDSVCASAEDTACHVVANVAPGREDDRCSLDPTADPACDEIITLSMVLSGGDVEEGDEIVLVPAAADACTDAYLSGISDEYFAEISAAQGSTQNNTRWAATVRAPWTYGDHVLCVRHKLIATNSSTPVLVDCPANWYARGSSSPEEASLAANEAGTAFVVATATAAGNSSTLTYRAARDTCTNLGSGARLCTMQELLHGEGTRLSSGATTPRVWTDSECTVFDFVNWRKTVGFWTMASSSPCAFADCEPSYEGERCWHDGRRPAPCATYVASDPLSRAGCARDTDWRLLGSNSTIPATKRPGTCMNGAACGNAAAYTISDGAEFMGGEACVSLNMSDTSPPRTTTGEVTSEDSGLLNHGAAPMVCVAPQEGIEGGSVVCCRGEMPTCELCPFNLTSEAGAESVGACTRCSAASCDQGCETSCGVLAKCTMDGMSRSPGAASYDDSSLCSCVSPCSAQGLCDVDMTQCGLANASRVLLLVGGSQDNFDLSAVRPAAFCDEVVNGTDALAETCCAWQDAYYYSASRDAMLIPEDPFASSAAQEEGSVEVIENTRYRVVRRGQGADPLAQAASPEACKD